jgi:hypothetical protein
LIQFSNYLSLPLFVHCQKYKVLSIFLSFLLWFGGIGVL